MSTETERLQARIIALLDENNDLKHKIRDLKDRNYELSKRGGKRERSPSPRVSRDAIHISGLKHVDIEKFKNDLEDQYGQLKRFWIADNGEWGSVAFQLEDDQKHCLEHVADWEHRFPNLTIKPLVSRPKRQK